MFTQHNWNQARALIEKIPVGVPLQADERPLVLALRGETVTNYEVLLRDHLGREYFLMVDASPIYPPLPS